jgi:hypothetical protein
MEAAEPAPEPPKELSMLERIRNMWEFAALTQYIFTFGRAVKIDENLDTEVYNTDPIHTEHCVISLVILKAFV